MSYGAPTSSLLLCHSGRSPPRRQNGRFKGVRKRGWGRWVSEIRIPHSREKIWLGSFSRPELAARAYDTACLLLRGPSASSSLNLSDSSHLITPHIAACTKGHHTITRRTIKTVAARLADALAVSETSLLYAKTRTEMAQFDTERGEESCTNVFSQNSTGEVSLQDLASAESRWIFDALNLHSPEENTDASSITVSAAASSRPHGEGGSLSCSASLDQQTLMSAISLADWDEFHRALPEALAQDGFIPMSCVVTTTERFDIDVASPDDTLWIFEEHHCRPSTCVCEREKKK